MYNMNISRPVTITTHVSLYRGLWIKAHRYFRGHQIWSLLERKDVEQDHWKCLWTRIQQLNFVMMMVISSIKATRNEKSGFINCKFWFQKLGWIFIRVHSQTEKFCLKFFRNSNFSCRSKRIVFQQNFKQNSLTLFVETYFTRSDLTQGVMVEIQSVEAIRLSLHE